MKTRILTVSELVLKLVEKTGKKLNNNIMLQTPFMERQTLLFDEFGDGKSQLMIGKTKRHGDDPRLGSVIYDFIRYTRMKASEKRALVEQLINEGLITITD